MANETQNQLGDEVYSVELAYAETPKRSAVKTFSLANVATLEVNASRNTFSTTIDVSENICSLPIPLSLVCSKDENFFRLSVDETMRECDLDDNSKGYVYTNSKGENFVFKELFYKVSDSGDKYYVNKQRSDITLKDGALYDEEDGKQVFIEYRQKDGWTVVPKIEGFKGIELIDTREEEEKQYAEQSQYYADILDNYVLVEKSTTDGVEAITITPIYENGYNGEKAPTLLSNSEEGTEQFILQKSDALTYNSIVGDLVTLNKEKEQNHERKSLLQKELENIEKSIEAFRNDAVFNKTVYTKFMDTYFEIGDWVPNSEINPEKPKTPWEAFTKGGIVISGDSSEDTDETEQSLNSILSDEEAKKFVRIRHTSNNDNVSDIYVKSFIDCLNHPSNTYEIAYTRYLAARWYFERDKAINSDEYVPYDKNLEMIVPRDEANRYASLLLQKSTYENEIAKLGDSDYSTSGAQVDGETTKVLKDRISALELQKEYLEAKAGTTLEELEKCRKEYATAKLNYDTFIATKPEFAITNGEIIKSFNKDGRLVSIYGKEEIKIVHSPSTEKTTQLSDENGNSITVTYYEEAPCQGLIKSIVDSKGINVSISYSSSLENNTLNTATIEFGHVDKAIFAFDGDYNLTNVQSSARMLATSLSYENGSLINLISTNLSVTSNTQEEVTLEQVAICERRYYDEPEITFSYPDYDEVFKIKPDGELLRHYETRAGLVSQATIYNYEPYWKGTVMNFPICDEIRIASRECLNIYLPVDFSIVDKINVSRTLNSFDNPVIETITGVDLTKKGIQNIVSTYTYDDMQNVTQKREVVTLKDSTVTYATVTKYVYANGILVKELTYTEGEELTKGTNITEYEYSEDGRVKKVSYNTLQSSDKICEESIYDKNGLKLCDYDVTGKHKIEYAYNKDTSLSHITLPNGSKFAYGYDSYGNVTSISQSTLDGEENSTDRTYSGGKIVELRSGNNKVNYTYDGKQRVTEVMVNGTSAAYHTYSQVASLTVPKGESTITYSNVDKENVTRGFSSYTSYKGKDGKLLKEEVNGCDLNYEYDDSDNVTKVDDTFHIRTDSYEYDDNNRLTNYSRYYIETENYTESITYDDFGNVTSVVNNENQAYSYTYKDDSTKALEKTVIYGYNIYPRTDCNGRNIGKDILCEGSPCHAEKIDYLKVGDHTTNFPSRITYANNDSAALGNITMTLKYSYDNMGNVSKIYKNGLLTTRYTYDGLNRLVREDNRDFGKTYRIDYDDKGNITGKYTYDFTLCSMDDLYEKTPSSTQTYEYDLQSDRLHAINGNIIDYDMYGFPSRYGLDGQFCTWYDNYLSGFGSTSFTRDNRGRRIYKNNILFIYDSQDRLIKQSNGVEFFYDHTGVAGISYIGALYTYEKDIFGNVISILDRDGRRVVQYVYDAWGNHKIVDGYGNTITSSTHIGIINPIRYRSYYYDTETGLYYLHARYYDPVIGRFISPDDVDYIDPETINGLNLYAYCGNNPVMNIDPTGHWIDTIFDLISLGISVIEVVINPADPLAWAGLAGDAFDLIPFVTGVGETIKGVKVIKKGIDIADDTYDAVKFVKATDLAVDFANNGLDIARGLDRTIDGFTISNRLDGIKIHKSFMNNGAIIHGHKLRVDGLNTITKTIYELKPYNTRNIRKGVKQILEYKDALGGIHKMVIVLY